MYGNSGKRKSSSRIKTRPNDAACAAHATIPPMALEKALRYGALAGEYAFPFIVPYVYKSMYFPFITV